MKHWIFLAIFLQITPDILLKSYYVEYSYVEPTSESLISWLKDFIKERKDFNTGYIHLSFFTEDEIEDCNDTICLCHYGSKEDKYKFISWIGHNDTTGCYTIIGDDTIFVSRDEVTQSFFRKSSERPSLLFHVKGDVVTPIRTKRTWLPIPGTDTIQMRDIQSKQ